MICILLTSLILISYYLIFTSYSSGTILDKVLLSSVMTTAQIVLTELLLGLLAILYSHYLVAINISIALIISLISYSHFKHRLSSSILSDINTSFSNLKTSLDGYNAILGMLVLSVYGWIVLSAYYLPIRGIDDLYYHLPPIFEYIQSHEIKLLPTDLHTSFAFPQNAELLFLWSTILAANQRMIDSLNVPFVILSIVTLYAICRHFQISNRNSLFASFLYALSPVIIMQSGTNYIDVIVSLYLLISLYFTIKFYDSQRLVHLYAAAVSIGMVSGMKYTGVFLVVPLHLLVLLKHKTINKRHMFFYFALISLLCGWWYLRNSYVLGDAFYPMNLVDSVLGTHKGKVGEGIINFVIIRENFLKWLLRYPLEDIGVGSMDGGFGLVFWGVGFSSWLYIAARSIINFRRTLFTEHIVLSYLPIGFCLLLIVPDSNIQFASRFVIFIIAIGLYAICLILAVLKDRIYISALKTVCVILSFMTVSLMTTSNLPVFTIKKALSDEVLHQSPSQFKYMADSISEYVELRYVWEPLDFITMNDAVGLNCFMVANSHHFNTAPVFGSNLQNRVLNFNIDRKELVEAYLYLYDSKYARILGNHLLPLDMKISSNYSAYDLLFDSNYLVVTRSERGCLLLHRSVIKRPGKLTLLQTYYQDTWPEAVMAANQIVPLLKQDIPLITSSPLGYGVRYSDFSIGNIGRVLFTLEGMEKMAAVRMKVTKFYSLETPINGYKAHHIADCVYNNKTVPVYLNSVL